LNGLPIGRQAPVTSLSSSLTSRLPEPGRTRPTASRPSIQKGIDQPASEGFARPPGSLVQPHRLRQERDSPRGIRRVGLGVELRDVERQPGADPPAFVEASQQDGQAVEVRIPTLSGLRRCLVPVPLDRPAGAQNATAIIGFSPWRTIS